MERYEIEAFLTLAEELHFGRTAERLRVSTTHISKTIKRLESRIGAPLFERTSRRVSLTPLGRQLHDDLAAAYTQIQQGLRNAIAAGRGISGVLRVGYFSSAGGQFLLKVIDRFTAAHPDCEVQIKELQLSDGVSPLRSNEIEIMLGALPNREPDLTTGPVLYSEAKMLAVSTRHPFARRSSVSLEDLTNDKMLRNPPGIPDYWNEIHQPSHTPSGRAIPWGPSADTFPEILALVGAGRGVYPCSDQVTRFYLRPDVTYVPLTDAPPLEFGLAWRTAGQTRLVEAFVRAAGDAATSGPSSTEPCR